MSRMLQALKQIDTQAPSHRPEVRPVSPEELQSFGLPSSVVCSVGEPQAVESGKVASDAPTPAAVNTDAPETSAGPGRQMPVASLEQLEQLVASQKAEADVPVERGAVGTGTTEEPRAKPASRFQEDAATKDAAACEPRVATVPVVERSLPEPLTVEFESHYRELAERILTQVSPSQSSALLFTSCGEGVNQTRTVAMLAAVLARRISGEVLAVDANFRRPGLGSYFGVRSDRATIDVVRGAVEWRTAVQPTAVPRLSVLPGRHGSLGDGQPAESLQFGSLLDTLRRHYRLVLLDAASLVEPESSAVVRFCEGAYLVIELGYTPRRAARQAIRLVERRGGRVLGCVLTGVSG